MTFCRDTWKRHIPPEKLTAYKQLIDAGKIKDVKVTYSRRTGVTSVEYYAESTHEMILEEMRKRSRLDVQL